MKIQLLVVGIEPAWFKFLIEIFHYFFKNLYYFYNLGVGGSTIKKVCLKYQKFIVWVSNEQI